MHYLAKSQLILSILVFVLGIAFILHFKFHQSDSSQFNNQLYKVIELEKRVRCLELGMTYWGDDWCRRKR